MRKTPLVVHHIVPETDTEVQELIAQSFQLYLRRVLSEQKAAPVVRTVSE